MWCREPGLWDTKNLTCFLSKDDKHIMVGNFSHSQFFWSSNFKFDVKVGSEIRTRLWLGVIVK